MQVDGGTLDLLMTHDPGLISMITVAPWVHLITHPLQTQCLEQCACQGSWFCKEVYLEPWSTLSRDCLGKVSTMLTLLLMI